MHKRQAVFGASLTVVLLLTAGCSPAVQPPAPNQVTGNGQIASGAWQIISNAVSTNEQAGMYRMKMSASTALGSMRSTFGVYGSFNPPDRAAFSMQVNNLSEQYYQQGTSAYAQSQAGWSQTQALPNVDVMVSYQALVDRAQRTNVPVRQLKEAYVYDEFCSVYEASLPADWLPAIAIPGWNPKAAPQSGNVDYVFYVGKKDGVLRDIKTTSVGSVPATGPVSVTSDTLLFDIGKPAAKVQFPASLLTSMESLH